MNHVDCWQALTIWQSGMLWHGNWWKLPFAGRSSPIGDHVDNCLFDLCLKQLSLNTPFQHLIGIPWQMHVPVGYPVQSIGENGNYRDNRRRLSGWTLHQTTSYVGLFTSFSSVCLWQRWQIKTNSNDFCKVSGIVCIQSLWSQWREEKSIFRSLHELSMVRFSL